MQNMKPQANGASDDHGNACVFPQPTALHYGEHAASIPRRDASPNNASR